MQDRNILGAALATVISPFVDFYSSLMPFLLLAILLIFMDCRYGIKAAVKRGEVIRRSRMWRRSINKLVDYICWIALAGLLGRTFGMHFHIPILSVIVLVVIYGIEITSIVDNYFHYKGIDKKLNFWKLLVKVFRREDLADVLEDTKKDKNETDKEL